MQNKKLLFIVNVDWYFKLHWLPRAIAAKEAGFDIIVATHFTSPAIRTELRKLGFSLRPLFLDRKSINPAKNLITKQRIAKLIDKVSPDIVHSITVKPNVYAGLACTQRNIIQIMSVTGLGLSFSSKKIKPRISKKIIKFLYKKVAKNPLSHILFENDDDRDLFYRFGIADKSRLTTIAGAGVNLIEYPYREELESESPIILFAARMLWDKGLKDLISAANILRKKGFVFKLSVAGILDEESSAAIPETQILQWHKQGDINWLGRVNKMPELITNSSIVCLPTCYGEGVPRFLIEAAAIGRPIVTTDVSGCRDIVKNGESGILVPQNNANELAIALESLLLNKNKRRDCGFKARQLVEGHFSQENVVKCTLAIYNRMLLAREGL